MKKLSVLCLCALCFGIQGAMAEIIETTATGTGGSEQAALTAALDNAVRQTHTVEITNDETADLSETHIVVKDDTEISESVHAKSKGAFKGEQKADFNANAEAHVDSSYDSNSSFWGRMKSRFFGKSKQSASASSSGSVSAESSADYDYSYKKKGGNQEYHDTSFKHKIDIRYSGAISGYEVLEHKESKGQHTVKIKAKIKKMDEYKSPELINKAKYTVAIVASDAGKKFKCVGEKVSDKSLEDKVVSKLVNKLSSSKKLSVVDRDNMAKQLKEFNLLEKDIANPDNANKLKQVKIADYLLVVKTEEFRASATTKTIQLTGEKISNTSGNMEISWRLIETATMEIVASGSESDTYAGSGTVSCNTVTTSMNKNIAEEISNSVVSKLN